MTQPLTYHQIGTEPTVFQRPCQNGSSGSLTDRQTHRQIKFGEVTVTQTVTIITFSLTLIVLDPISFFYSIFGTFGVMCRCIQCDFNTYAL